MLNKYEKTQNIFYKYIINSVENGHISHAYLIETNGVSYGYDLAVSLAKFFLCIGKNSIQQKLILDEIDKNIYSDLYIINSNNNEIKKTDVAFLKHIFSFKSQENNKRVYIINNANLLNASSANTLLKFLEEPNDDIIAILVTDSRYDLLNTIVSRCQVLSLINNESFIDRLIWNDYDEVLNYNDFVNNKISNIVNLYCLLELSDVFLLTNEYMYSIKNELSNFFLVGLALYYDIFNLYYDRNLNFLDGYDEEKAKIMKNNTISDIIKKIDIINLFINKSKSNANKDLLIDEFTFKMLGDD
jgi:hypothetical protein